MENTEQKNSKKKRAPLLIIAIVLVSATAFGINKYFYSLHHVDTDDAQIDADINPVLARVSGYVDEIRFEENQHVNKGEGTLGQLAKNDSLYFNLNNAANSLDELVRDFNDNPRRYIGVSLINVGGGKKKRKKVATPTGN